MLKKSNEEPSFDLKLANAYETEMNNVQQLEKENSNVEILRVFLQGDR